MRCIAPSTTSSSPASAAGSFRAIFETVSKSCRCGNGYAIQIIADLVTQWENLGKPKSQPKPSSVSPATAGTVGTGCPEPEGDTTPPGPLEESRFQYDYDANDKLTEAAHSTGKRAKLTYSSNGLLERASLELPQNASGRPLTLLFYYDIDAKLTEVKLVGVGSIKAAYNNTTLKAMKSPAGDAVTRKVKEALLALLSVVQPVKGE